MKENLYIFIIFKNAIIGDPIKVSLRINIFFSYPDETALKDSWHVAVLLCIVLPEFLVPLPRKLEKRPSDVRHHRGTQSFDWLLLASLHRGLPDFRFWLLIFLNVFLHSNHE